MPVVASHDGLALAVAGDGVLPGLVMVHANGFCKEIWRPLLADMGDPASLALDQRGHGDSGVPQPPFDWWDLGRDVLSVLDAFETSPSLVGVGHSSGGTALVMAEILRPQTFAKLVLVEPIITPPPFERGENHPLALLTEKRRRSFASPVAAYESYRDRPPFASWDDRALRAFVDHGFESRDGRWALKCSPATEAEFYRAAGAHGAWARLDEVRCRVDLVFGSMSDAGSASDGDALGRRFPRARMVTIGGAGHLMPMERPGRLAEIISEGEY